MSNNYPNLIILGAQKSGTTTLHNLLKEHPDIFMSSPVKEPGLFFDLEVAQRMLNRSKWGGSEPLQDKQDLLQRFMRQGYKSEKIFGESTTSYTIGQNSRKNDFPARISTASNGVKFIYIIRNPFERLISNYKHAHRNSDKGSFDDFLAGPAGKAGVLTSCYWYQLKPYVDEFGLDKILLLKFDDLIENQAKELQRVYCHLGVSPHLPSKYFHLNKQRQLPSIQNPYKASLEMYEPAHAKIVKNLEKLSEMTGFDTSRWDIDIKSWCRPEN